MDGIDITGKLRAHLDKHGYKDVEMKVIGDVPWAKMRYDTDIARALTRTYDTFSIRYGQAPADEPSSSARTGRPICSPASPLDIPIVGGAAGHGGNATRPTSTS